MPIPAALAKFLIKTGIARLHPGVRRLMGDGLTFLKYYSSRILEAPNEELRRTQAVMERPEGLIDLSLGAPPMLAPLQNTTLVWSDEGYPSLRGHGALRQRLAQKWEIENGLSVDPDHEVLVCNGASQALGLFLDTFLDPGDKIALFDPGYFMYRLASQYRRLRMANIPIRCEAGLGRFSERDLKSALKGSRGLLINSPGNPTGAVIPPSELERIAYWCARYDVLIFSDEVYEHFNYQGHQTSIARFPDARNRTISAFSWSKTYGLAGLRVGAVCGNRWLLQPMSVAYLASAPFVSALAQQTALLAMEVPRACLQERRLDFQQRRDAIHRLLNQYGIRHELPGGAFFFWIELPESKRPAHRFAYELRQHSALLTMPGESLSRNGSRYLRISFAGSWPECEMGIGRLIEALTSQTRHQSSSRPRAA
jgi:aminotransferase